MTKDLNVFDKHYGLLINGEWTNGSEGNTLTSHNPANGEALATFIDATDADVDAAVNAAKEAFKTWKNTSATERATILNKIADIIDENTELFALQETLDNGKPIRETRAADIPLASDHFRYFASVIRAEEGVANQLDSEDLSLILREPIGVVGQIIPWNFPFLMAAWKIAPALAAGCTVVIHPSSSTSLSLLSLAQKLIIYYRKVSSMLLLVRVLNLANTCCTILDLTNWHSPVPPKSVEKLVWLLLKC